MGELNRQNDFNKITFPGKQRAAKLNILPNMINPIISWVLDSDDGFFVNITGFPASNGAVWSGTLTSPVNRWEVTLPPSTLVSGVYAPNFVYQYPGSALGGKRRINGNLAFSSGGSPGPLSSQFGGPPWTSNFSSTGWQFSETNWKGDARITFTWSANPVELASWRYSLDILVKKTA